MITNVLWVNNRIVSFQSKIIFFLENITFPNTRKSFYFPKSRFRKSADFKPINILDIQFLSILKSPDPLFSKKCVLKLRLPKQISQTYETRFFVFLRKLRKNVSPVVDGPQAEKKSYFLAFLKKITNQFFDEKKTFSERSKLRISKQIQKNDIFHGKKCKFVIFKKYILLKNGPFSRLFLDPGFERKTSKTWFSCGLQTN